MRAHSERMGLVGGDCLGPTLRDEWVCRNDPPPFQLRQGYDFSRRISQISTGVRVVDRTPNPDHRLSRSTALGSDCSRTGWFRAHYETDSTSIR